MMLSADLPETSCSPLRPPKTTATRIRSAIRELLFKALQRLRLDRQVVPGHAAADAGENLVRVGLGPSGPVLDGRLAAVARAEQHDRIAELDRQVADVDH